MRQEISTYISHRGFYDRIKSTASIVFVSSKKGVFWWVEALGVPYYIWYIDDEESAITLTLEIWFSNTVDGIMFLD